MSFKDTQDGDRHPTHLYTMLERWPRRKPWFDRTISREERWNIRKENGRRRALALLAKRAVCPIFSVSVSSGVNAPQLALTDGCMPFRATLKYEGMPVNQPQDQHVVLRDPAVFSPRSVSYGHFKIYTSPSFEHALPVAPPQPLLRRPRGPDDRFLTPPPIFHISAEEEWVELAPGDEITRDLVLDPSCSSSWRESLRVGGTYLLRYDPHGAHPFCKTEIESYRWRFGTLAECIGKDLPTAENSLYIGISLEPSESSVKFRVV